MTDLPTTRYAQCGDLSIAYQVVGDGPFDLIVVPGIISHVEFFHELPEDSYEAFLSVPLMCRGRVMGVINLQHRQHHVYRRREIRLISTIGFLVGAEIEMARLEDANSNLSEQLQTRKVVERAKGILQRDLALTEEQAYLTLQRQSRQKRKAMKEIAEAIVLSDEVRGNPLSTRPA